LLDRFASHVYTWNSEGKYKRNHKPYKSQKPKNIARATQQFHILRISHIYATYQKHDRS
jgi:hypothetical protein